MIYFKEKKSETQSNSWIPVCLKLLVQLCDSQFRKINSFVVWLLITPHYSMMSSTIMNITSVRIITSTNAVRIKRFTECPGVLFHRNLWNQCFSSWDSPPDGTAVTPLPTQRRAPLTPLRTSLWKTLFCQHSNSKINCSTHYHSISCRT